MAHLRNLAKMSSNGWEIRFSNSRQIPYFYNTERSISTWEPPSELSAEQIQQLPGAAKYMNVQLPQTAVGKEGQVRASHILAKHAGSRRPASWRNVRVTLSGYFAMQADFGRRIRSQSLPTRLNLSLSST